MKKLILLLSVFFSLSSFAQKYVVTIDTVQKFQHDTSLSITTAINLNKVSYLSSSTTDLKYTFDLDNMLMYRQYKSETINLLKIIKVVNTPNNLMEVYVLFDDGIKNYLITRNLEMTNKYVFMSREQEEDKIVGWFDPTVEIKKRP